MIYKTLISFLFIGILATSKTEVKITEPAVKTEAPKISEREKIISYAKEYLGINYKYASSNPSKGFDCSGFVNYVFKHFDISVPRSSSQFKNIGKTIKPEAFQKGDILVFYGYKDTKSIGHVGIICEADGMNSKFIHASSGKEYAVTISDLNSKMYTKRFYKCVSVL
ncbi:C40 family peptidase [uncultured Flavobacterium sp.]|uniref:C40 family peptidase n=1 Tax=uncultured Flavobacterium sp. TaxID=165435 RepID=UPI0025E36EED|nr:C40 family peptidase [uncultured Flavobacterium sp.]